MAIRLRRGATSHGLHRPPSGAVQMRTAPPAPPRPSPSAASRPLAAHVQKALASTAPASRHTAPLALQSRPAGRQAMPAILPVPDPRRASSLQPKITLPKAEGRVAVDLHEGWNHIRQALDDYGKYMIEYL